MSIRASFKIWHSIRKPFKIWYWVYEFFRNEGFLLLFSFSVFSFSFSVYNPSERTILPLTNVGGANFGHGVKTPGRDEARDGAKWLWDEAKASRRSSFEAMRRPRGEVTSIKAPDRSAALDPSCTAAKSRQRRRLISKGSQHWQRPTCRASYDPLNYL